MRREAAVVCGLRGRRAAGVLGDGRGAAPPAGGAAPARVPARASAAAQLGRRRAAARCAVPEDPARPGGTHHRIARRRRARAQPPRRRRRRCFCWRADPGQAASDLYASYAGAFARINRNHDIVLRRSARHREDPPRSSASYPDDWQADRGRAAAAARRRRSPASRRYRRSRALSTPPASRSRDLERVRAALGYRDDRSVRLVSYGTRVAELYMRRYPAVDPRGRSWTA